MHYTLQSSSNKTRTASFGGLILALFIAFYATSLRSASTDTTQPQHRDPNREKEASLRAVRIARRDKIHSWQQNRRSNALEHARLRGWPTRRADPGSLNELIAVRWGRPLYYTTFNANAAISTGANLLNTAPWALDGKGVTVGVWDAGAIRSSHREFDDRVTVVDNVALHSHSTHVAGTIAAKGIDAAAKGMAPQSRIKGFDWNYDFFELLLYGAATPYETNKIAISNHSYGFITGWTRPSGGDWTWTGSGTDSNGYDPLFGMYTLETKYVDTAAYNAPYLTMFWGAGNDRNENPSSGTTARLGTDSGSPVVQYSTSLHPPGDGAYRDGYDTMNGMSLGKNIIAITAVNDAVTTGQRDLSKASMSAFSSWGPSDDGRIKPDLVANGNSLRSTISSANNAYANSSGTSMASPNAAGTAALLAQHHVNLFGRLMRSATLKALLIHTADDLGRPGPDYSYGWGLINAEAAAVLMTDAAADIGNTRMIEDQISEALPIRQFDFYAQRLQPLRVTLCWNDPPAEEDENHDSRRPDLINDLDLQIVGPKGTIHLPYVMPFVGDWSQPSLSYDAITGSNHTDNVEQVYLAAPPHSGTYRAKVTYTGSLKEAPQEFSLVITSDGTRPPAPTILMID